MKGDRDALGLTENPAAVNRWMLSGPEMARVVGEFEASTEKRKKTDHEQTKHAQMAFARDLKALTGAIEDVGNPFCEKSSVYLLVLDTRGLADAAVIDTLNQIEKLGQDGYDTYSGRNKYLIPCRFCKFTHLQRNEQSIILMVGLF